MPDPTATTTIPCPRCGTDISEAAAIRRAVTAALDALAAEVRAAPGGYNERGEQYLDLISRRAALAAIAKRKEEPRG